MNLRDGIILQKVLSEVNIAAGMMKGCSLTEFLDNEMLKRAVCMTVINVGELVKNLTEDCRLSHPEVAWKEIAGFRDIAAHKYQTLRMEDVYETAVSDRLPGFAAENYKDSRKVNIIMAWALCSLGHRRRE